MPPQAQTPEASNSSANPVPAHASQNTTNMAPPTGVPATTPATAQTSPSEEPVGFNDRLNANDRYWKFKAALQTVLIIVGIIGTGCVGWATATVPMMGFYDTFFPIWPPIVTFVASIIWCSVCILVCISRKKPVHPGTRVAIDLILWLSFLVTVLFAMATLVDLMSWGNYGDINGYGYYSSTGDYELASNGTWVWEQDDSYVSSPRSCKGYSYDTYFENCAQQDAYINKLWQEKPHRVSVELAGVVCQFISLVLHFTLFVWACVDTHHHNRNKVSKDAEKIAAGIVQTMINNGAVIPPPGQAYMRPAMGQGMYYQLPPQQAYPLATMYPQRAPDQYQQMAPGQYRAGGSAASGPATGPSDEKSQGPRFA